MQWLSACHFDLVWSGHFSSQESTKGYLASSNNHKELWFTRSYRNIIIVAFYNQFHGLEGHDNSLTSIKMPDIMLCSESSGTQAVSCTAHSRCDWRENRQIWHVVLVYIMSISLCHCIYNRIRLQWRLFDGDSVHICAVVTEHCATHGARIFIDCVWFTNQSFAEIAHISSGASNVQ